MKNIIKTATFVILSVFLSSCLENTNDNIAYGDVFAKSTILDNGEVGFSIQLYAYSMTAMENVDVYLENSTIEYSLDTFDFKYTYAYQPEETIHNDKMPESGQYFFNVTFEDGSFYHGADFLKSDYIEPTQLDRVTWDDENKRIDLVWTNVEGKTNLYSVHLLDESGKLVFESELMEGDVTSFSINQFTYGWYTGNKPAETAEYTILLYGYLFEPVASTFDIQCISVNDKEKFLWNLEY